jgi:hypothetical protein
MFEIRPPGSRTSVGEGVPSSTSSSPIVSHHRPSSASYDASDPSIRQRLEDDNIVQIPRTRSQRRDAGHAWDKLEDDGGVRGYRVFCLHEL